LLAHTLEQRGLNPASGSQRRSDRTAASGLGKVRISFIFFGR